MHHQIVLMYAHSSVSGQASPKDRQPKIVVPLNSECCIRSSRTHPLNCILRCVGAWFPFILALGLAVARGILARRPSTVWRGFGHAGARMQLEAKHPGSVSLVRGLRPQRRVAHQNEVGEGRSKVSAIHITLEVHWPFQSS
jgi:hypothetical protein